MPDQKQAYRLRIRGHEMQRLVNDLEALLAAWDAQAKNFDSCDMPASALAFRKCQRRLGLVLASNARHRVARQREANFTL